MGRQRNQADALTSPADDIPVPDDLNEREAEIYRMAYRRGASAERRETAERLWRQR